MMIRKIKGKSVAFRVRVLIVVCVLALLFTGTAFAATSANNYVVDIYENGEVTRVETSEQEASDVLKNADFKLSENDKLNLDSFTVGQDSRIVIYRCYSTSVTTPDGVTTNTEFAGTVGDLLKSLNITMLEDDVVNYPLYTPVTNDMSVEITKAYQINVIVDGETKTFRVGFVNVADALNSSGIAVGKNDIVSPDVSATVFDGMEIKVSRVELRDRTETESIAYSTVTKKSVAFYSGSKQVTQDGVNGTKKVVYTDKYVDGVLSESNVTSEKVTKNATTKIITVGTGTKAITASSTITGGAISELALPSSVVIKNGSPTSYKSVTTGKACAYTASSGAKTASGRTVKPGYVAVDPNQFPYGTELWIVATDGTVYGYAIASDTGGFVNQGKFTVDLFMNTRSQCMSWGSKDVVIYVL